jgi:hypothetical protein
VTNTCDEEMMVMKGKMTKLAVILLLLLLLLLWVSVMAGHASMVWSG